MKELRGRFAVVTGAASGIGQALAARFAAEGMKVMLADIEEAALSQAAAELTAAGAFAEIPSLRMPRSPASSRPGRPVSPRSSRCWA